MVSPGPVPARAKCRAHTRRSTAMAGNVRVQQAGKEALSGPMLEQPGTELAQDREVKAGIGQLESEQGFPVNPASDGLGRLAVAQPLAERHERNKGQPPRRIGGLAKL